MALQSGIKPTPWNRIRNADVDLQTKLQIMELNLCSYTDFNFLPPLGIFLEIVGSIHSTWGFNLEQKFYPFILQQKQNNS